MSRVIKFRAWDGEDMCEVCTVDKPRDRRGAHNFKGYQKRHGYIARLVSGHPYADGRGYVLEHRLIMEEHLGRFLKADEIVHHINHIRDDNNVSNLSLVADQKRHAAAHAASAERDSISKQWLPDPTLSQKKFRLFNKNTGLMEIKNLSQLINTTFRKSQFEYRGEWTGLQDKNGVDIYEGDIVRQKKNCLFNEGDKNSLVSFNNKDQFVSGACSLYQAVNSFGAVVIGNIHENPELLEVTE